MDAFIGEVRAFPYSYIPQGWFACDGSLQSIASYQALYSLLGTTYGGDGRATFGLPNLQGRTVIGIGQGPGLQDITKGEKLGAVHVALTSINQLPAHNHAIVEEIIPPSTGTSNMTAKPTVGSSWLSRCMQVTGRTAANTINSYVKPAAGISADTPLHPNSIGYNAGGSQGHENRQPYLTMVYCINYDGVYPISS
ncbi:MAG: tail fiber protein [Methylobacter sp.]|uniref:phage tail protein n=1 Tax=Methylobacter sp. TaxID=2051955 RepID=UPI002731F1EC|nr:tail fiber protein [Methylobacter sp.]MDP1663585.1 tail fiber protein [Methylobacter sp.]